MSKLKTTGNTRTLPRLDHAWVDEREGGHVVITGGKVIAGPFRSQSSAWHWIDRNEVYETWQKKDNP